MQVNPLLGEASATVGAETLLLRFDMPAFVAVEAVTGESFLETVAHLLACAETGRTPRLGAMQALLFGATRGQHRELTLNDCGALYLRHSGPLTAAINEGLVAALPKAEEPAGEA